MKRPLWILTAMLFALSGCKPEIMKTVAQVGKAAPEFALPGSDGKSYTLSQFMGKTVVLEWLNHQCPFVKKHYDSGNMQKLQNEAVAKGVVWLSIISSAPGKQGHVDAAGANQDKESRKSNASAVLLDPSGHVGRLYGAKTTPHMYVVDPKGTLAYAGAIDDKRSTNPEDVKTANNYVRAALGDLLAGKPVSKSNTKPYGCSVKY